VRTRRSNFGDDPSTSGAKRPPNSRDGARCDAAFQKEGGHPVAFLTQLVDRELNSGWRLRMFPWYLAMFGWYWWVQRYLFRIPPFRGHHGDLGLGFKPSLRHDYPLTPWHSASRPIMDRELIMVFHRPIRGDSRCISDSARFGEIWFRRSSQSHISEPPRGPITRGSSGTLECRVTSSYYLNMDF